MIPDKKSNIPHYSTVLAKGIFQHHMYMHGNDCLLIFQT